MIVTTANEIAADGVEARTTRKLRHRLIPLLFLLYVIAYLDRINIGFASLTMNSALGITSAQYGLLVGIFFWGYFIFEVPSNLLLHKMGARVWIARILISWGIVAMLTGAVHSVQQLYVARFLLGVAEAGFFPGIVLYLTYWFRQREQARVISLFVMALPVASILGAPVSGYILDHAHWAALESWRWLLILEGLPAIAGGVLAYLFLPSRPDESTFLTSEGEGLDLRRTGPRKSCQTRKSLDLGVARLGPSACVAPGRGRICLRYWVVRHGLLHAPVREITVQRLFQHRGRHPGDDSSPGGASGNDLGVPQFRPPAGTALPRRHSLIFAGVALMLLGTASSALFLITLWSFVAMGTLQLLRSVLLYSEHVSDRIFRSRRYRLDKFRREPGWVCRPLSHRSPCPRNLGDLRRPAHCRLFARCIGDTDTASEGNKPRSAWLLLTLVYLFFSSLERIAAHFT